jgi:hypothetical protein
LSCRTAWRWPFLPILPKTKWQGACSRAFSDCQHVWLSEVVHFPDRCNTDHEIGWLPGQR